MAIPHSTTQNHLLAAFPATEYARIAPALELVPMPLGMVLSESGGRMQHLFFADARIAWCCHGSRLCRPWYADNQHRQSSGHTKLVFSMKEAVAPPSPTKAQITPIRRYSLPD